MSTWHQRKGLREGRTTLQHDTLWAMITDPPNDTLTIELHSSCTSAEQAAKRRPHSYVLPPRSDKKKEE